MTDRSREGLKMNRRTLLKTWLCNLFRSERNKRYPVEHPKLENAVFVSSYVASSETEQQERPND